jgi:hypothetical protein
MTSPPSLSRRRLLERLALAVSLTPVMLRSLPAALAADAPLLSASAPEAQAVKYVENATEAKVPHPEAAAPTARSTRAATVPLRDRVSSFQASS